ncbi:hypothetical protein JX266_009835 [Neoarthrinium moseri]|nr:hypothetical protein JX266_009835 [Neoarthrinium moseri]
MLSTVIKSCPSADNDFQPLSEYQAQTPETFYGEKPVLYFHDANVKAWCSIEQSTELQFFAAEGSDQPGEPTSPENNALENTGKHLREARVEVFVASHKLIIFSHKNETGIEIPYPAISLHAVKNFKHLEHPDDPIYKFIGVYMQLEFSDGGDDDDSFDPIELTLVPSAPATTEPATVDPLNAERASALFNQISACQNLHPDPADEDEDEEEDGTDRIIFEGEALEGLPGAFQGEANGGLPPPMPGSSGWITADNVHEYFDADGNWIGEDGVSGELGEGAGRVRGRDEVEGEGEGVNGKEADGDAENKRPRTE